MTKEIARVVVVLGALLLVLGFAPQKAADKLAPPSAPVRVYCEYGTRIDSTLALHPATDVLESPGYVAFVCERRGLPVIGVRLVAPGNSGPEFR